MSDLREYLWDASALDNVHGGIFHVPEGKKVDVTDPCYDRDVWCRMQVELPAGGYVPFTNMCDGRVAASGIVKDVLFAHCSGAHFKEIGNVGVDAGLMGFFIDKPDYDRESWMALCNKMNKVYEDTGKYPDEWETPEGFFTSSGWGDGCYPVYLIMDAQDTPMGVMVVYMDCYTDIDDEEE